MKIREIEETRKKYDSYTEEINNYCEEIENIINNPENEDTEKLNYYKNNLKRFKAKQASLNFIFPKSINVYVDRNILGNAVAELMSEIMDKEYVYQENYLYKVDNRYLNLIRYKVYTIVNKKIATDEPYMNYYDAEDIMLHSKDESYNYYQHDLGYKDEYAARMQNQDLFELPFSINSNIAASIDEKDIEEYKKGNTVIEFTPNNSKFGFEATINGYTPNDKNYNKIISDFIITVIVKGLYEGRTLTKEEIAKIRIKFIELYRNSYTFKNYENYLYELTGEKVYKKD